MKSTVSFQQGKQNQDIDERYITNGEYRELINGRVLDSDEENAGCITSLKGTQTLFTEPLVALHGFKAIATTTNEDCIYVFFSNNNYGNIIKEYNTITKESCCVFIDADIYASLHPQLWSVITTNATVAGNGFSKLTKITSKSDVVMHVYEGMLYWHDREDEPFKINIARTKEMLNYYTTRAGITVAKMPPSYPYVTVVSTDTNNIQKFNLGSYKFAARYVYEDGEVSAISPLSDMPIRVQQDVLGSTITTSGSTIDANYKNNITDILSNHIVGSYKIEFSATKHSSQGTSPSIAYGRSFCVRIKDGHGNYVGNPTETSIGFNGLSFTNIVPDTDSQHIAKNVFTLTGDNPAQTLPNIMCASASRRDDGKDVIAFVINTFMGHQSSPKYFSHLFIYDMRTDKGYYALDQSQITDEAEMNWDFHSVHVTQDGNVFVGCRDNKSYFLALFHADTGELTRVIGDTADTTAGHRIAKPNTIASDYTGNIVYYVHSKNDNVILFQSVKGGHVSTFKTVATRDIMFADTLQYIKEYNGHGTNKWNIACCCSADGLIVYVGCCNCIARSDDAGQTWQSYVIEEHNLDYGAVIDLTCSADGKAVYAVVGVGDIPVNDKISVSNGEITDNNYPAYSGDLFVSLSYGRSFNKTVIDASTIYYGGTPYNGRVRNVHCSDDGTTVVANGFIWSYFKSDENGEYDLTDYPAYGKTPFCTLSTMISTNYATDLYPVTWGQGIKVSNYTDVLMGIHNGYVAYSSKQRAFGSDWGFDDESNSWANMSYGTMIAHTRVTNDIKKTTIENDVSEINIQIDNINKHIKTVQFLMWNDGTYYLIKNIDTNGSLSPVSINFNNNGSYMVIPSKDANKLYDNVPLKANTSDIAQDALIFGGYTDGYDTFDVSKISVELKHSEAEVGNVGLKSNTKYSYGIIAYDAYNRSTTVMNIGEIQTPTLADQPSLNTAVIRFASDFTFPDWVKKFKFCRTKLNNNYYIINGFDSATLFGNKLLLEITSNTSIAPHVGDTIELVYDYEKQSIDNMVLPIVGYIDNKSNVYTGEYEDASKLIGDGRYIVVANNQFEGYNKAAIISDNHRFTSSIFYINCSLSVDEVSQYYEIPYTFSVRGTKPQAELYKTGILSTENGDKVYTLKDDGDVVLLLHPLRELSLLSNNTRFTSLGRISLYSENARQMYRHASICVSEPYVQDSGFNGLSSFNTALVNYKDLDRMYGEIEAIDGLDDKIAVFQKYRCSQVQYKKNILSTATGESLVSNTQDIFGEQVLYALEYGLTDHHSLVKWGNTRFFVDQKRGAVLRIDYNGIHNISDNGMRNYFYNCLENYRGRIMGCYDVAHSSYMLFHEVDGDMVCDNYYVPVSGWSARFEIDPDIIVNTMNGVFSIKGRNLYKHDVLDVPSIYGEYKDITMKIPCNEEPNIIKSFNAIQVDSTTAPYFGRFITRTGISMLGSSDFEHVETEYQSYIPMIGNMASANPMFCCMVNNDITGNIATLPIVSPTDIHIGDTIMVCIQDDGQLYQALDDSYIVVDLTPTEMTIEGNLNIPRGALLFAIDPSQTNGYAHKDTSMMIELRFTSATVVKSITVDINESKI